MSTEERPPHEVASLSPRLAGFVSARAALEHDFFGGWLPEDIELFEKYKSVAQGAAGYLTDYFGVRTADKFVPWAVGNSGCVFSDPPIPDDGVRAEAIEYFALLRSFESSKGPEFTMIELGASYAPWACLGGVLAVRHGKKTVNLRAVEASSFFHEMIDENFRGNGLTMPPEGVAVHSQAIHGAVGTENGIVYFPVVTSAFENGGQSSHKDIDVDYVGRVVPHEPVPVRTLEDIFEGLDLIDLVHCDIQGAEASVLTQGIDLLDKKVRTIFVGTHSRQIEGILIECFHAHGWSLVRERPVAFIYRREFPSTVGMTIRDGGQYWINSRFAKE